MSNPKDSRGRYRSSTDQRTPTPGVYRRVSSAGRVYYRVQTRPDGDRKVMHTFSDYEEACAFKAANAPNRKGPKRRARLVPTTRMAFLLYDPCSYCGEGADTFDHIVPTADGGEHHWTNLAPACRSCNSQKNTRSLLHFMLARSNGELSRPSYKRFDVDGSKPLFDLLGI